MNLRVSNLLGPYFAPPPLQLQPTVPRAQDRQPWCPLGSWSPWNDCSQSHCHPMTLGHNHSGYLPEPVRFLSVWLGDYHLLLSIMTGCRETGCGGLLSGKSRSFLGMSQEVPDASRIHFLTPDRKPCH